MPIGGGGGGGGSWLRRGLYIGMLAPELMKWLNDNAALAEAFSGPEVLIVNELYPGNSRDFSAGNSRERERLCRALFFDCGGIYDLKFSRIFSGLVVGMWLLSFLLIRWRVLIKLELGFFGTKVREQSDLDCTVLFFTINCRLQFKKFFYYF